MTQEELYWLEKRLRLKADDEERKIREKYDRWIKASEEEYRANIPYQDRLCRSPLELRLERDAKIEFARLEILEPVLDAKDNARLRRLRKEKEEEQERKKQEEERIRKEEEERRRKEEEEKKKREEEERRLAPIREREAAERKRKEIEEQERRRKEKEKEQAEQKRKERIKTALLWLLGIVIAGGIVTAIIIFWDTILVVLKWVLIIAVIIFVLAAAGN